MKKITYIFYKLFVYFKKQNSNLSIGIQKINAFIVFVALVMFNLVTIRNVVDIFFNLNLSDFGLGTNAIENRFVRIPLLLSPLFLLVWVVYRKNKPSIEEYLVEFEAVSGDEKTKLNRFFWIYVIITCVLMLLSTIYPALVRH